MKLDFTGKHVVVTGGTGALGAAVTELLLKGGAKVSIPCFDESELKDVDFLAEEFLFLKKGIDLTDEYAAENFYKLAVEKHGTLWASVNTAGGFTMDAIENTSRTAFMKQIDLNLITCFNACKTAISHMQNGGGRIVNIASRPGLEPRQGAGMSAYTVSKAGVAALTQSLAAEVVDKGILINAVAPSIIDTPENRRAMPDADFRKWPKPQEIATQILALIAEQNKVTRGAVIPVYGRS